MESKLRLFWWCLFTVLAGHSAPLLATAAQEGWHMDIFRVGYGLIGFDNIADHKAIVASMSVLLATLAMGFCFRQKVQKILSISSDEGGLPPASRGFFFFVGESFVGFIDGIAGQQCGHYKEVCLPFLAALFLFILLSNLLGLVPGLSPSTLHPSVNLALALLSFGFYNGLGIKEHGGAYIKQFMGPFLLMAPIFLILEAVSHMARPISLALRLTINIYGDHTLAGVFADMVPLGVPAVLSLFGLLVACIQSFVFSLLTAIYINMAISHDH